MKAEVLVDYFTFSVKLKNPDEIIRDYLGMDPALFESFPYGFNGYLLSKRFSSIVVCFNGYADDLSGEEGEPGVFDDMGVCVSMSGDGCRAFERYSSLGFPSLFKKLVDNMSLKFCEKTGKFQGRDAQKSLCNVSRIDVACDEKAGLLDMDKMVKKTIFKHEFNSRMRKPKGVLGKDGDEWDGRTIYIGAPSSDFRIRIYDKVREQVEKGNWKPNAKGDWIRVEMVMRRENALGFILQALLAESIGELAAQVLNEKFRFIERDDTNISRCSVSDWWANFVEEIKSVVIWSRMAIQHSIYRVEKWLRSQVSTSMAMIALTYGLSRLREIAEEGEERLSRRQEALVHDFNAGKVSGFADDGGFFHVSFLPTLLAQRSILSQMEIDRCFEAVNVASLAALSV